VEVALNLGNAKIRRRSTAVLYSYSSKDEHPTNNGQIMMRLLPPLALAGLLAACAPTLLQKENVTAADLAGDTERCASLARMRLPTGDPSMSDAVSLEMEQAMRRQTFVSKCLQATGWH
jgi:hypothetical protein